MDTSDLVWNIVWSQMRFYLGSYELVLGNRSTMTSFRRQIRCLKRLYAMWYRQWQVQGILREIYADVLWSLTRYGFSTVR